MVLVQDHPHGLVQKILLHHAQQGGDVLVADPLAAERHDLLQGGFGVPHAPAAGLHHEAQRLVGDPGAFLREDAAQPLVDLIEGDDPEIELLTAGDDGLRDFVQFGRCQDENNVGRRLLERLEQRVERLGGQHMDFIDDEDLVPVAGGGVLDVLAQLADLPDAAVGGRVDLQNVDGVALGDLQAGGAGVARVGSGALVAVERLGQDAGRGCLADAPRAREQVGVGDPTEADGVLQGAGDGLLAHHLLELLGAPFAGDDLV